MKGSETASEFQSTFAVAAQNTERVVRVEPKIDDTLLRDCDNWTAALDGIVDQMGEVSVISEVNIKVTHAVS